MNNLNLTLSILLSIARPERVREQIRHLAVALDPRAAAQRFRALLALILDAEAHGERLCAPEDRGRWLDAMEVLKARHGRVVIRAPGHDAALAKP